MTKNLIIESGALAIPEPDASGIRVYKGVPYAAPPIGALRWRAPQPVAAWTGVRPTHAFGPSSLQGVVWDDIDLNGAGMSEDCLYLNVWTPAAPGISARLPAMVWIHGGGFVVGSGAEPRYDGAHLAARGVVVVTLNHRLNALGLLAHPELSAESDHRGSGAYGMLDLVAALQMGQAQHRCLRRRSGPGHDRRRIRRLPRGERAHGLTPRQGTVRASDRRERSDVPVAEPRAGAARESRGRRPRLHAQGRRKFAGRTARRPRGRNSRRRAGARFPADYRRMVSAALGRPKSSPPASRATCR